MLRRMFIILLLLMATEGYAQEKQIYRGREFWGGFLQFHGTVIADWSNVTFNYYHATLTIGSEQASRVTISIPRIGWSETIVTKERSVTEYNLPLDSVFIRNNGVIEDKGVHIISDHEISVNAFSLLVAHTEASAMLPSYALGSSYVLSAYHSNKRGGYEFYRLAEFLIVATEDNTQIRIAEGKAAWQSDANITLQRGQCYSLRGFGDPTGTIISSPNSKNFALYGGAIFEGVVYKGESVGIGGGNLMTDINLPVSLWGREYISVPFDRSGKNPELVRILASENNTTVQLPGRTIMLDRGRFYDTAIWVPQKAFAITADKPVSVAQYGTGEAALRKRCDYTTGGDATFLILSPGERMLNGTTWFSTIPGQEPSGLTCADYLKIVVPTAEAEGLELDGKSIKDSLYPVPDDPAYSYGWITLGKGSHNISSTGRYLAYLYGWGNGESYSVSLGLSIGIRRPAISAPDFCAGSPGNLEASADERAISFDWSFGDGRTGSGKKVSHSYEVPGTYRVQLITGYNEIGEQDTVFRTVTVHALPKSPVISYFVDTVFCRTSSVDLRAENGWHAYRWSTGETTKDIRVNTSGTYTLTVLDSNGCEGKNSISVRALDLRTEITGPKSLCTGAGATRYTTKNLENTSYYWEAEGGEIIKGQGTPEVEIMWKQSGRIQLIVQDFSHGCTDTSFADIKVSDKLSIEIKGIPAFCRGGSTELSADEGYAFYEWDYDGVKIGDKPEINADKAGTYTVKVKSANGCEGTASVDVKENSAELSITADKTKVCPGEKARLSPDKDFVSYRWNTGETTKEISAGAGQYSLTAVDANGCEAVSNNITLSLYDVKLDGAAGIPFGSVETGGISSKKTVWTNTGSDTVKLSLTTNFVSSAFAFSSNPPLPASLGPGEDIEFTVNFVPDTEKPFNDKITLALLPCNGVKTLDVSGSAEKNVFHAEVSTIDTTVMIGNRFIIPLKIRLDEETTLQRSFTAVLTLNRNVLHIEGINKGSLSEGAVSADGRQELRIELDEIELTNKESIAVEIGARALVSVEKKTALELKEAGFTDPKIITRSRDGKVQVVDACFNQPVRLFTPSSMSVMPNPVSEEAELSITLSMAGSYEAELYTSEGILIKKLTIITRQDGETVNYHEAMSGCSSGSYMLVLQAPDALLKQSFFIVR